MTYNLRQVFVLLNVKGRAPVEHLIGEDTSSPDVDFLIILGALYEFRR